MLKWALKLYKEDALLKKQNAHLKAKAEAIEAKAQETEKRLNLLLKVLCAKDKSAEFCKGYGTGWTIFEPHVLSLLGK